jgi:hypothetical protein
MRKADLEPFPPAARSAGGVDNAMVGESSTVGHHNFDSATARCAIFMSRATGASAPAERGVD